MLALFKKTEFIEFDKYKQLVDRLDDIYFMNYVARQRMKN